MLNYFRVSGWFKTQNSSRKIKSKYKLKIFFCILSESIAFTKPPEKKFFINVYRIFIIKSIFQVSFKFKFYLFLSAGRSIKRICDTSYIFLQRIYIVNSDHTLLVTFSSAVCDLLSFKTRVNFKYFCISAKCFVYNACYASFFILIKERENLKEVWKMYWNFLILIFFLSVMTFYDRNKRAVDLKHKSHRIKKKKVYNQNFLSYFILKN